MDDFIKEIELFYRRLNYLEKIGPVKVLERLPRTKTVHIKKFVKFLDEVGLSILDYIQLVPIHYIVDLDVLVSSTDLFEELLRSMVLNLPFDQSRNAIVLMSLFEEHGYDLDYDFLYKTIAVRAKGDAVTGKVLAKVLLPTLNCSDFLYLIAY